MQPDSEPSTLPCHQGGCHCGRVRFEVRGPLEGLTICNCSICTMKGFIHFIVPLARFRVTAGGDQLTSYTFNTGIARHTFCRHCGIHPFYVPRSDPDKMDVNVRCLDGVDLDALAPAIARFDGRRWEAAMSADEPPPWRTG